MIISSNEISGHRHAEFNIASPYYSSHDDDDDDGDVGDDDGDDDVGDRKWDKIETSMVFGSRRGHIPVSMSAQVQVVGGNCDHLEIVNITSSTTLVLVLVDSSRIISFWQPLQPL